MYRQLGLGNKVMLDRHGTDMLPKKSNGSLPAAECTSITELNHRTSVMPDASPNRSWRLKRFQNRNSCQRTRRIRTRLWPGRCFRRHGVGKRRQGHSDRLDRCSDRGARPWPSPSANRLRLGATSLYWVRQIARGPKPFSLVEQIGDHARVGEDGVVASDSFGNGHVFCMFAGAMCGMLGHAWRFF